MIEPDMPQADMAFELVINGRFLSQRMTGVQRVAREFVLALDRRMSAGLHPGLCVRLVAPPDAIFDAAELQAIVVQRVGGGRGHWWEQFALPRRVGRAALLCLGNSAPIASLLGRRPVAVMVHDLAYRLFPADYSWRYRLLHRAIDLVLLRRARPLVTVSAAERAVIGRLHPSAAPRILVAANGGCRNDAPPPRGWAPHRGAGAYGLYVGSLSERKNGHGIVGAAIDLARNAGIGFKLVGPPGALTLDIPEDVRALIQFCGYVDDDTLSGLYAGASFFLFPSFYEASGLPPVEAMTIGCPVVVSDIPVMRERCAEAALYCDPHDRRSIVRAALALVEQPALAQQMSRLGKIQAAGFTWDKQVERVISAIAIEVHRDRALAG